MKIKAACFCLMISIAINAVAEEKKGGILQQDFSLFGNKKNQKKYAVNQPQRKAMDIIQQALTDSDPRIRANAAEVVAATKQIQFMPKVKSLLTDEYVPVRFAAAVAVADVEYKLAQSTIKKLLKAKDENTKIAAAYAMIKLGNKKEAYENIIFKALTNTDQTVRANAVALLGKLKDTKNLDKLYWALKDKDSGDMVRFQALEAIAMLGDEDVIQKIWPVVISSYNDDRVIAIRALGQLGTDKAKEIIATKLDDDVLEVRLTAAAQLGRLNDNSGQLQVIEVFENNLTADMTGQDLERINFFTAMAIGEIATPDLTEKLPQFLEKDSKIVKIAAAKAVLQTAKL